MDEGDQPTWILTDLPLDLTNCPSYIPVATAILMDTTNPQFTDIPLSQGIPPPHQAEVDNTFLSQSTALAITMDTCLSNVEASIASNTLAPIISTREGSNPASSGHTSFLPVTGKNPLPYGSGGQ
eukprot:3553773-Ditylum_brightwellii.AAC.1